MYISKFKLYRYIDRKDSTVMTLYFDFKGSLNMEVDLYVNIKGVYLQKKIPTNKIMEE